MKITILFRYLFLVFTIVPSSMAQSYVTYNQDIADILNRNCISCHQSGGIAPFSLETFQDASQKSFWIEHVTSNRIMPPFPIDGSGQCQTFKDVKWLTQNELSLISDWTNSGAQEGSGTAPEPPTNIDPVLPEIDAVIGMNQTYMPSSSNRQDDYRCFLLDNPEGLDKYITGFRVSPGNTRIAHHAILFALQSEADEILAQELDDQDPGYGYTCFGGAMVNASIIAGWAPGTGATLFPDGTGVKALGKRKYILQMHYNLRSGPGQSDRSIVELDLEDQVAEKIQMSFLGASSGYTIPGGQDNASLEIPYQFRGELKLWGVYPHMHLYGKSISIKKKDPSLDNACMAQVDRWNFNWQRAYFYETPFKIKAGEEFSIKCGFDTRNAPGDVKLGHGTDDEMCIMGVYYQWRTATGVDEYSGAGSHESNNWLMDEVRRQSVW